MQPFNPEQEYQALRRQAAANLATRGVTLLGWCLFLLGTWIMMRIDQISIPLGVRQMMMLVMVGMLLIWPAVRLSHDWSAPLTAGRRDPGNGQGWAGPSPWTILGDWVGLALVMQVVVWPLVWVGSWTLGQASALNAALLAWSLLIAALVAWGVRSRSTWARSGIMVLCVAVTLGEPLAMVLLQSVAGPDPALSWDMRISPLATVWYLATPGGIWQVKPHHVQTIIAAGLAAGFAWMIVLLLYHLASRAKART